MDTLERVEKASLADARAGLGLAPLRRRPRLPARRRGQRALVALGEHRVDARRHDEAHGRALAHERSMRRRLFGCVVFFVFHARCALGSELHSLDREGLEVLGLFGLCREARAAGVVVVRRRPPPRGDRSGSNAGGIC